MSAIKSQVPFPKMTWVGVTVGFPSVAQLFFLFLVTNCVSPHSIVCSQNHRITHSSVGGITPLDSCDANQGNICFSCTAEWLVITPVCMPQWCAGALAGCEPPVARACWWAVRLGTPSQLLDDCQMTNRGQCVAKMGGQCWGPLGVWRLPLHTVLPCIPKVTYRTYRKYHVHWVQIFVYRAWILTYDWP